MIRNRIATLRPLVTALAAVLVANLSPPADAQAIKLGRVYFEDHHNGYRFKFPKDWLAVPAQPREKEVGVLTKFAGEQVSTKVGKNQVFQYVPDLTVLKFTETEEAVSGEEATGGLRGRVNRENKQKKRPDVKEFIPRVYGGLRDFEPDAPVVDELKKVKGLQARHRLWHCFDGNIDLSFETWTFTIGAKDVVLLYTFPTQHDKKVLKVTGKSAKSFQVIDVVEATGKAKANDYEGMLAYHEDEASRTPGWRVVPTPSRKFIIKTSSDDDGFVDEVIERLEMSRELFERDWPPTEEFDHVSIVRICKDGEEFRKYANVQRGVAGLFNPRSIELILFDYQDYDRNMTYAVMSHEAFHQYCHFLFGQSEAHRWFDEGHGDYYGGVDFKRKKAIVTKKMPGGLARLPEIKQLVREGTYHPLSDHLNYSHQKWQSQGPSNVSCYAQSWSVVFMLRQGMAGQVPKRLWKKEYADILPNYVATLRDGFQTAYDDILAEREKQAKEDGRELTEEERKVTRFDIQDPDVKKKIWKDAMAASWGKIDLDEFEASWLAFIKKEL